MNYGLYAVIFSIPAAMYIFKAVRLNRKQDIAIVIAFSIAHVYKLVAVTAIL